MAEIVAIQNIVSPYRYSRVRFEEPTAHGILMRMIYEKYGYIELPGALLLHAL